jgi:hypothetical protein
MKLFLLSIEVVTRWVFYVLIVAFALLLLTTLQVRQQIKAFDDFKEYADYANQISRLTNNRNSLEDQYFNRNFDQAIWAGYKEKEENILREANLIIQPNPRHSGINLEDPLIMLQSEDADLPELKKAILDRKEAMLNLTITQKALDQVGRDLLLFQTKIDSLTKQIRGLEAKAQELLSGNVNTASASDPGKLLIPPDRRAFTSLASYLDFPLIGRLVSSPADFLVMLLAMFMGAVGGILSVARSVVDPDAAAPKSIEYFLRPVFGFIIALVVFVLFKAGQIALSSTSSDVTALNPFVVGFIGVISGAMAKPALDRIERAGASLFGEEEQKGNFYARGLRPLISALTDEERTLLVRLLNIQEAVLNAWLTERELITAPNARVIAAFLRLPLREIFTNEPA